MNESSKDTPKKAGGYYLDRVHIANLQNIVDDIAGRLYVRHRLGGQEYIITDQPSHLLILLRKRWIRLIRQAIKRRNATNDPEQLIELSRQIAYMQNLTFTEQSFEYPDAKVIAKTFTSAITYPPTCLTMYITVPLPTKQRKALTALMPTPNQIVIYERPPRLSGNKS